MTGAELEVVIGRVLDAYPELADVVITAGKPIQAEVDGVLRDVPLPELQRVLPKHTKAMAMALLADRKKLQQALVARGSCDLSYAVPGRARFRANIFSQRGTMAIILRRLPTGVPSIEGLGLPTVFRDIAREKYGLVLVTGGTGSGKSNSLAAVIDEINTRKAVHIITLEDPVEFTHRHKQGTVNQRELGVDFDTFASGLRAAFRQAPKVILVGEIRDRETMEIALQAAGTGHLVLSTLHTTDAGGTIGRILGLFDSSEERLVRMRLAESLRYVVSQRLLPRADGSGRVAAFEVLKNTMRIRELILNGEAEGKTFYGVLHDGEAHGMRTFDQEFFRLYASGAVTEETALLSATDRSRLGQAIDQHKTAKGEKVTDLELDGLEEDEF